MSLYSSTASFGGFTVDARVNGNAGDSYLRLTVSCGFVYCSIQDYYLYLSATLSATISAAVNRPAGTTSGVANLKSLTGVPAFSVGFSVIGVSAYLGLQFALDMPWTVSLDKSISSTHAWAASATLRADTDWGYLDSTLTGPTYTSSTGPVPATGYARVGLKPRLVFGLTASAWGFSSNQLSTQIGTYTWGVHAAMKYAAAGTTSLTSSSGYTGCGSAHSMELTFAKFSGTIDAAQSSPFWGKCAGTPSGTRSPPPSPLPPRSPPPSPSPPRSPPPSPSPRRSPPPSPSPPRSPPPSQPPAAASYCYFTFLCSLTSSCPSGTTCTYNPYGSLCKSEPYASYECDLTSSSCSATLTPTTYGCPPNTSMKRKSGCPSSKPYGCA